MITTEELIRDFSEENFAGWCRGKFADFVPKSERLDEGDFSRARQIGYVRTLADGGVNRPLLIAAVQVPGELGERSSRKRQFEFARKALKRAAESPPGTVKGVMSQGLFVFCGENGDFRMSLVTGRVEGGKPVYNSFKRQTFFVRHDEVNRTFRDQTAQEFGDFKALCEAFSIEALARQFYKELFAWYEWALSDEMDVRYPNDIHTDKDNRELIPEHMIRLITRLMFVWFIKQKRLVPEEIFRVEELRKLLKNFDPDSETDGNYYNAILQNLFFATLNNQIEDRAFATNGTTRAENENHYGVKTLFRNPKGGSWFKVPDARILKLFEKVPFLNGGLFECLDRPEDEKTKRILYYDGFSREEKVKGKLTRAHVPNGLFFNEERGLIPLFQRYNFTVEENSPNDAVVALDPELLGKVFENLLGAYNPETQETARKQSGSFYTPREIVSYMVDESLKQFLKTRTGVDDAVLAPLFEEEAKADLPAGKRKELAAAIRTVKILDPACGSGAFPMGALHRLVDLLVKREGQPDSLYDLKLHLIENCIYGVDIQTIAVQISKLRFFISLVCEQEPNGRKADNYGILPLPNLETKFVAANTLIGLEKEMGDGLNLEDEVIASFREELKEVRHRHFSSKSSAEKQKLRQNDKKLRQNIEKRIVMLASTPNLEKIADLEAQIRDLEAEKAKFKGGKWEMVVEPAQGDLFGDKASNAPQKKRVDTHKAKREQLEGQIRWKRREIDAEKRKKATDVLLEEAEKLAKWNPYDQNESSPFFDPEWMFGITDGFDVVIGNPPYLFGEHLADKKKLYKKSYEVASGQFDAYWLFYERSLSGLLRVRGTHCFINSDAMLARDETAGFRKWLLQNAGFLLMSHVGQVFGGVGVSAVVVLVLKGTEPLLQYTVVPYDEDARLFGEASSLPISGDTKDPKARLRCSKTGGASWDFLASQPASIGDFFEISRGEELGKKHLSRLEAKSVPRGCVPVLAGEGVARFTPPRPTHFVSKSMIVKAKTNYDSPKIVIVKTGASFVAAVDDESLITLQSVYNLRPKGSMPCELGCALLNSSLLNAYLKWKITGQKKLFPQITQGNVLEMPVPDVPEEKYKVIVGLVERILTAKEDGQTTETATLERQIDERVYKLYGLTAEEIKTVEGACGSPKRVKKQTKPPPRAKAKSKSVLVDDEGLD